MKHKVRVTVIDKKIYPEFQEQYPRDSNSRRGGYQGVQALMRLPATFSVRERPCSNRFLFANNFL